MPETLPSPAGLAQGVITVKTLPGKAAEFAALEGRINAACVTFPGFVNFEVSRPVAADPDQWVVRMTFDSQERLQAWLQSDVRREILAEEAPLVLGERNEQILTGSAPTPQGVTVVIHARPQPEKEAEYARWQDQINAAAATYPGFQEARVFPPQLPHQPDWSVAYSFDNQEHLEGWLQSDSRREWLERGAPLFKQTAEQHLLGGFGSWFAGGDGQRAAVPPGWKQVMTVVMVLYPTVMLIALFIMPGLTQALPPLQKMALGMFVSNIFSVSFLQYVAMSPTNKALRFWLVPDPKDAASANARGVALVVALYVVTIGLFYWITGGGK